MADAYFPQGLDSGQSRVPGRQRDLLVAPMAPPSFANSGAGDGGCGRSQPTIFFDGRGAPGVETRHVDILVSGITIFFMFSPSRCTVAIHILQFPVRDLEMHCQSRAPHNEPKVPRSMNGAPITKSTWSIIDAENLHAGSREDTSGGSTPYCGKLKINEP